MSLSILYFYIYKGWLKWSGFDFRWERLPLNIILVVNLAIGLWLLFLLKNYYLHDWLESVYPSTSSLAKNFYAPADGWLRFGVVSFYIAISAGIVEEFIYRSFLIRNFEKLGLSTWLSVVLSVALFVFIHWSSGASMMFNALLGGTILSLIYVKTRNIMSLVLAHFIIDISFSTSFDNKLFSVAF